jgi:hypothetical protein
LLDVTALGVKVEDVLLERLTPDMGSGAEETVSFVVGGNLLRSVTSSALTASASSELTVSETSGSSEGVVVVEKSVVAFRA